MNSKWRNSPRRLRNSCGRGAWRSLPSALNASCYQILDFNPGPEGGSLVIGEIVSVHINEQHIKEGRLDRNSLDLIGRMGGMQYTRTTERFEMVRPKVE